MQLSFFHPVHLKENNSESQNHLEANRNKFSTQCDYVLYLLSIGVKLTSYSAMTEYRIGHLARRIKDLKDSGRDIAKGFIIEDEFEKDMDGVKTRNKVWYAGSNIIRSDSNNLLQKMQGNYEDIEDNIEYNYEDSEDND
jgi:hypothetical protein